MWNLLDLAGWVVQMLHFVDQRILRFYDSNRNTETALDSFYLNGGVLKDAAGGKISISVSTAGGGVGFGRFRIEMMWKRADEASTQDNSNLLSSKKSFALSIIPNLYNYTV